MRSRLRSELERLLVRAGVNVNDSISRVDIDGFVDRQGGSHCQEFKSLIQSGDQVDVENFVSAQAQRIKAECGPLQRLLEKESSRALFLLTANDQMEDGKNFIDICWEALAEELVEYLFENQNPITRFSNLICFEQVKPKTAVRVWSEWCRFESSRHCCQPFLWLKQQATASGTGDNALFAKAFYDYFTTKWPLNGARPSALPLLTQLRYLLFATCLNDRLIDLCHSINECQKAGATVGQESQLDELTSTLQSDYVMPSCYPYFFQCLAENLLTRAQDHSFPVEERQNMKHCLSKLFEKYPQQKDWYNEYQTDSVLQCD